MTPAERGGSQGYMKPRLSRSLRRILAGVVVCCQMAQAVDLDWAGTTDSLTWDTTALNWLSSGTDTPKVAFTEGDNVTFIASPNADVSRTVGVSPEIKAGQIVINDAYTFNAEQDAVISGSISGTGDGVLTKSGFGMLTLNSDADNADSTLGLVAEQGALQLSGTNTYGTGSAAEGAYMMIAGEADITFSDAVTATDIINNGTLRLRKDSAVDTLSGEGKLVNGAEDDGDAAPTLTLTNASFLGGLENYGTLNAQNGITLDDVVTQGGNVTSPRVTLNKSGNVFTSLNTDSLQMYAPDASAPVVTTETIAPSTEGSSVNVQLETVNRAAEHYTLVNVTGDTSAETTYTLDPATLALYRAAGFDLTMDPQANGGLDITLNRVPSRYYHHSASTPNARAGADIIHSAFLQSAPQWNRDRYNDLANVMDSMDAMIAAGTPESAAEYDKLAASVSGAGVACLGIAWRTQMERQLRSVRDRVAVMKGGMFCCPKPDPKAGPVQKPCFSMWVNGDIDYQNQRGNDSLPGFKLSGIGGTIGAAGRIGDHWILGGALSGMAGRIRSKGYGSDASGDLDSYYGSIFTRFDHGCWSHSLNASIGLADVNFKRHVYYPGGSYDTKGTPDGLGLGIMYEVARSFRINQDYMPNAWIQPVFNASFIHSSIDSYTESGSDAALRVAKQEYNNVIFGLGARMQTLVGRRVFNSESVFNLRVLGKAITGDRRGTADVRFVDTDASSKVRTSKRGALGVEIGGGFAIPMERLGGGSIFAECSAEFMSNYSTVNGALGYRVGF